MVIGDQKKGRADRHAADISVNAAGDINLETAAARICIKNNGEIVIEGTVTVNGSAI